jgi:hypothetical protein
MTMRFPAFIAIFVVGSATAMAATANVELTKGKFFDGTQMLTVKNNSTSTISRVHVICGFFRNSLLVGTHGTSIFNLLPGESGSSDTNTAEKGITNVECRIDDIVVEGPN